MQDKHELGPLTFGFDIGIASVGWAILAPNRIVALGVRAFDKAEDEDGKPLNQTRRQARVARNRNQMRSWRLKRLLRLLGDVGILEERTPDVLIPPAIPKKSIDDVSPWHLRSQGLARKLEPIELARVLYHLTKHRGFEFFRKAEDPTEQTIPYETAAPDSATQKERDGLKSGLEYTSSLLKRYPHGRTIGSLVAWLTKDHYDEGEPQPGQSDRLSFGRSKRNRKGDYRHAFRRRDLRAELVALMNEQA